MKLKDRVLAADIAFSISEFRDAAADNIEANKFGFNERREQKCYQELSDLCNNGELFQLLVRVRHHRKQLSWFRHRKFLKVLKRLEKEVSHELFEDKLTKKQFREMEQTLSAAEAYITASTLADDATSAKRQSISNGPEKCRQVAHYYYRLATVSEKSTSRRFTEYPFEGNWFSRKLAGLKHWWSSRKAPQQVRFGHTAYSNGSYETSKYYKATAKYIAKTAEPNNVLLKVNLIRIHRLAKNYDKASELILELLPEHTSFEGVDACYRNKVTGQTAMGKVTLSLISELLYMSKALLRENTGRREYYTFLSRILSTKSAVDRLNALQQDATHNGARLTPDEMLHLNDLCTRLNDYQQKLENKAAKTAVKYATTGASGSSGRGPLYEPRQVARSSRTVELERNADGRVGVSLHM